MEALPRETHWKKNGESHSTFHNRLAATRSIFSAGMRWRYRKVNAECTEQLGHFSPPLFDSLKSSREYIRCAVLVWHITMQYQWQANMAERRNFFSSLIYFLSASLIYCSRLFFICSLSLCLFPLVMKWNLSFGTTVLAFTRVHHIRTRDRTSFSVVVVLRLTLFSTFILLFVSLLLWLSSLASSLVASIGGCHIQCASNNVLTVIVNIWSEKNDDNVDDSVGDVDIAGDVHAIRSLFISDIFLHSIFFHFAFVLVYGFQFVFFLPLICFTREKRQKQSTHGCASSITKLEIRPEINVAQRMEWVSVDAVADGNA